ncbi:hypothetical protein ACV980_018470 [Bacillus safensis]|uniref:hypothetical protein n=1 Tax=Bacillus safensis TaxID=561879 RepID=UPI000AEC27CB|nr:hypothetical protein R51_19510 [Bacillus safensis]
MDVELGNINNNRNSKIETLKRKSRRQHLMNKLSYMTLPEHPFLDIEEKSIVLSEGICFPSIERT